MASVPPRTLGLTASEAAAFDAFVVPRYLALFGELVLDAFVLGNDAQILHVNCRSGYPDRAIVAMLANAYMYGVDPSPAALELARTKAAQKAGMVAEYTVADSFPLPFPDGAFSHAFTMHPLPAPKERQRVLAELARVTAPGGQAILAMPVRGSFQEVADLLREYALKHESSEVANAVEAAVQVRPTRESLVTEMERAGFGWVDVEVKQRTLKFKDGHDFFDDPITRLLLLPEFRLNLGLDDTSAPMDYLREAIDAYFRPGGFELGVQAGCVTGRKK